MNALFRIPILIAAVVFPITFHADAAPEVFEVGAHNKDQLPKGKEADGIIGDYVLRNDRVEAVISGNLPLRRPNMSNFYGATGMTPGCLYDLTLRGTANDQITIFAPSSQQGFVSHVRIVKDGRDGEAVIETVTSGVTSTNRLYKRHEYRLRDGWPGVLVVTTLRNDGAALLTGSVDDRAATFTRTGTALGINWADAVDPADKAGYAWGWVEEGSLKSPPKELSLRPGEEISFARFLAVGRSPAEAVGHVAARRGPIGMIAGQLKEPSGAGIATGRVEIEFDGKKLAAYPDANGKFTFALPPGNYEADIADLGREPSKQTLRVEAGKATALETTLPVAAAIEFDIRDEKGRSLPCKAQFIGINGTKSPNLGPNNRAHGCLDQYHSARGTFRVALPAGQYRVVVTRGIEFSHLAQTLTVTSGKTEKVAGTLRRLVDSRGWVSADFHNHSTPSGDNTCGTDDRVINLAAEHIEFAPTTEHNRLYDWTPHIARLGLTNDVSTIGGLELTGAGTHFNTFPFTPVPFTQDAGAPVWNKDPRLNAITLRDWQGVEPNRWVQMNHPDLTEVFFDRNGDGALDGGYLGIGSLVDGFETQNGMTTAILSDAPFRVTKDSRTGKDRVSEVREFIWLQLLNRGVRQWATAVSDAHAVHGNGVGGWRMYLPSASDEPGKIDWREMSRHARAGRSFLTTGPFLEVRTEDGILPGGLARATGSVKLNVRVQCADWVDIDRVQVLVNGRQPKELNFTRASHPQFFQNGVVKFDRAITVPLSEDAHLIVVAMGENFTLATGYGSSEQARLRPCAYHNPIFVDVDGNGFKANGDTLGHPLPVKKISVDDLRRLEQNQPQKTTPAKKAAKK